MTYQRHTLCYLDLFAQPLIMEEMAHQTLLAHWLDQQFPLIFTYQPPQIQRKQVQLAIPYVDPKTQQKIRFSYLFPETVISHSTKPPTLQAIFPHIESTRTRNIRVYGSYCWQYLTQKKYVHPNSDLDLLIQYQSESLVELKRRFDGLRAQLPLIELDGEIQFPHLGNCSFAELLIPSSSETILFKSEYQIRLVSRDDLYAIFPTLLA